MVDGASLLPWRSEERRPVLDGSFVAEAGERDEGCFDDAEGMNGIMWSILAEFLPELEESS